MTVAAIIPIVGQMLKLGFEIADVIERADDISPEDKKAMREAAIKAQDRVTFWTPKDSVPLTS